MPGRKSAFAPSSSSRSGNLNGGSSARSRNRNVGESDACHRVPACHDRGAFRRGAPATRPPAAPRRRPSGLEERTKYILLAWQADIDIRTRGLEHRSTAGLAVEAHDITAGVVHQDANVKVTAFPNAHGELPSTFGYRFDTADRSIVISGDTSPSQALVASCRKRDVLIHEAYSEDYRPADMANWLEYRSKSQTTTTQLADIAPNAQP